MSKLSPIGITDFTTFIFSGYTTEENPEIEKIMPQIKGIVIIAINLSLLSNHMIIFLLLIYSKNLYLHLDVMALLMFLLPNMTLCKYKKRGCGMLRQLYIKDQGTTFEWFISKKILLSFNNEVLWIHYYSLNTNFRGFRGYR